MGEQDTSIKTTKDVRDRLRILASERGTTMNELLKELVTRELTEEEKEQRRQHALEEVRQTTGVTVSDDARARARSFLQGLGREHHAA
ncbi:ribbon-helix-helix protein [Streptomyces sp. CA-251387]|uniref:ribbon-helix-helix protein n=1 Tax=Streptomyces sp. CA-251387 TaxID=3240064 RepID=UPI003D912E2A